MEFHLIKQFKRYIQNQNLAFQIKLTRAPLVHLNRRESLFLRALRGSLNVLAMEPNLTVQYNYNFSTKKKKINK
jgi:hypothetical protein